MKVHSRLIAVLAVVIVAGACSSGDASTDDADPTTTEASGGGSTDSGSGSGSYEATITRTTGGVPHIQAADLESAAFGQGWASAEDHACSLADQILKVFSRRAEFLGPGEDDENVESDFAWVNIGLADLAAGEWPEQSEETRSLITAYTGGWNTYLAETGAENVAGWCAAAEWLRPIEPVELYTYARSIALNASSNRLIPYIGGAQPPDSGEAAGTPLPLLRAPVDPGPAPGSNGWALGSERAEEGNALLLANPHFPWEGELRFWEVHLDIEDGPSVYGAQLTGLPGVGLGFTDGVGWTHTVSAGNRFTAYTLDLVEGDPTSYLYDGEPRKMDSIEATIKVLDDDGSLTDESRTLYRSQYGPMLDFPGVGWTEETASTFRDANIDNDEIIDQYAAMSQAESLDDLVDAQRTHQGVPLFNTVAAGSEGRVWYADTSATPKLSEEALAAYEERLANDPLTQLAASSRAVLLEGSNSRDEWVEVDGARDPGLVPFDDMPQQERDDYVLNANDSFWISNADEFIEGDYSPLHGTQSTVRSPRTRQNFAVLDPTDDSSMAGDGGLFTLEELQGAALEDTAFTATALRQEMVARCTATSLVDTTDVVDDEGTVVVAGEAVDLTEACGLLESWDGRFDVDSVGAIVWREFLARVDRDSLWEVPFDEERPLETPSGLSTATAENGADANLVALGQAVQVLTKAGVDLATPLGDLQVDGRQSEEAIAIPGGTGREGVTNVVSYSSSASSTSEETPPRPDPVAPDSALTPAGYWINYGTSILMAVEFTDDGPQARSILTYGTTSDRTSDLFTSQTKMFSDKQWKTVMLSEDDIAADAISEPITVSG